MQSKKSPHFAEVLVHDTHVKIEISSKATLLIQYFSFYPFETFKVNVESVDLFYKLLIG